jgi:hypothetical protein
MKKSPLVVKPVNVLLLGVAMALSSLGPGALGQGVKAQDKPPKSARSPQGAGEITRLEFCKPIEREMRGGETHYYQIHVEAGQFVHVVVLQEGIDVGVTLRDPAGKEVAKTDSMNGSYGPEPVSAISAVSGDFRLEIVAGSSLPGRYKVEVTDLRIPVQSDRTRMEAERIYMEGANLYSQGERNPTEEQPRSGKRASHSGSLSAINTGKRYRCIVLALFTMHCRTGRMR